MKAAAALPVDHAIDDALSRANLVDGLTGSGQSCDPCWDPAVTAYLLEHVGHQPLDPESLAALATARRSLALVEAALVELDHAQAALARALDPTLP